MLNNKIPSMTEIWKTGELIKLKGQLSDNTLDVLVSNVQKTEVSLNQSNFSNECISVWLNVICSACRGHNADNAIKLLTLVCHSTFFKTYVGIYVRQLQTGHENLFDEIKSTIEILTQISQRFPSLVGTIGIVGILSDKVNAKLSETEDSEVKREFVAFSDQLNCIRDDFMKHFMDYNKSEKLSVTKNQKVRENFREIPVLPRVKDILYDTRNAIRPNKSKGAYQNLEHYLDIQFKLYREDCISPLRESISEYVCEWSSGRHIGRLQDGRLYKKVRAKRTTDSIQGLQYTVTLDKEHAPRKRWKNSRRLIYGTLVCISPDHFRSLFFAVVTDRDQLEDNFKFDIVSASDVGVPIDVDLTMVESSAYFEAYRHVLTSLQRIHEGDLPFERYIVKCCTDLLSPKYLLNREEQLMHDLNPIINECKIWDTTDHAASKRRLYGFGKPRYDSKSKFEVDVLSSTNWPTADSLHMDSSQFEAYKAALSNEFVLIQGPPGTGKTYVALQIAKTLLHNEFVWNHGQRRKSQLLIVCFTNHALDQFVEGIVSCIDKDSDKLNTEIIRVGGRSQNENMNRFSLKDRRRRHPNRSDYRDKRNFIEEAEKNRYDIAVKKWIIKHYQEYVMSVHFLSKVIPEEHLQIFGEDEKSQNEYVLFWLGLTHNEWLKRAAEKQTQFSGNYKTTDVNMEEILIKRDGMIEVKTEAEQAEDDRRIEEEVLPNGFVIEDLGIKIAETGNSLLRNDEYDVFFKRYLKAEIEESISYLRNTKPFSKQEAENITNKRLKKLPLLQRWQVFKYWEISFVNSEKKQIVELKKRCVELEKLCHDAEMEIDKDILSKTTVIAMTTSSAARYQSVLCDIGPRIVIVEEAAEVLEAHIIASLSPKCEHLILIGDHKQLEPKASVFELAIKYNLGLSMFERMLNNGLEFHCLERQHRMRPGISQLVRGIYPKLIDNENVMEYPRVGGAKKDVFFISHSHREDFRDDIRSYSNQHEADFVKHICNYLLLQGYKSTQITILAAYTGQMFLLQEQMPKAEYDGVRISAIDNFQGEENDIILLSLVRSNEAGKIGFLNRENRICVALSRAKIGLYVIGDFDMLTKNSSNWKKVVEIAESSQFIGHKLPLYCQNHPNTELMAAYGKDFKKAPQGGCEKDCEFRLECGHACRLKCHPKDASHIQYKCLKPCRRVCINGHVCKRNCHGDESKMSTNRVDVKKDMLGPFSFLSRRVGNPTKKAPACHARFPCGHICIEDHLRVYTTQFISICKRSYHRCSLCRHDPIDKKCLTDKWKDEKWKIEFCKCNVEMKKHLKCGHSANFPCFVEADFHKCEEIVTREFDCGHDINIACHVDMNYIHCEMNVTRILSECGHESEMECWKNPDGYLCTEMVERTLLCGHTHEMKCHKDPKKKICRVPVDTTLPCGHTLTLWCSSDRDPTSRQCRHKVERTFACGHRHEMECHENPKLKRCDVIVSRDLNKCAHGPVDMKCSEPVEKYECAVMTFKALSCGHEKEIKCFRDPTYVLCGEQVKVNRDKCDHTYNMSCPDSKSSSKRRVFEIRFECKDLILVTLECGHHKTVQCCLSKLDLSCTVRCGKVCPDGHECGRKCHFPVDCKCSIRVSKKMPNCDHSKITKCCIDVSLEECMEEVTKKMPLCNHNQKMSCFENPETITCQMIVNKKIPSCGHKRKMRCSRTPESVQCIHPVIKQLPDCGHCMEMPCFRDPNKLQKNCKEIVLKELNKCGHATKMTCGTKPEEYVGDCSVITTRELRRCGHSVEVKCSLSQAEAEKMCTEMVSITLSVCGHIMQVMCGDNQINEITRNDYLWNLECLEKVTVEFPCGHSTKASCHQKHYLQCKEVYSEKLPCGHTFKQICDKNFGSYKNIYCKERCNKHQICGHVCNSRQCNQCQPCKKKCENRCPHGPCPKSCFEQCDTCDQPCTWKCEHFTCSKSCSEICDRPRCEANCKLSLKCGHQCPGLCGEPCPPRCINCIGSKQKSPIKKNELMVYLTCGHLFPVHFLDNKFESLSPISLPRCPECLETIHCHPRYGNIIKEKMRRIGDTKRRITSVTRASKNKAKAFPFSNLPFVQQRIYVAQFGTFINVQKQINSLSEELKNRMSNANSVVKELNDKLDKCPSVFVCSMKFLMYKVAAMWLACLSSIKIYTTFLHEEDDNSDEDETKEQNDAIGTVVDESLLSLKSKTDEVKTKSDIVDTAWRILDTMNTIDHETLMSINQSLQPLLEQNLLVKRIMDVPVQCDIVDVHVTEQYDKKTPPVSESFKKSLNPTTRGNMDTKKKQDKAKPIDCSNKDKEHTRKTDVDTDNSQTRGNSGNWKGARPKTNKQHVKTACMSGTEPSKSLYQEQRKNTPENDATESSVELGGTVARGGRQRNKRGRNWNSDNRGSRGGGFNNSDLRIKDNGTEPSKSLCQNTPWNDATGSSVELEGTVARGGRQRNRRGRNWNGDNRGSRGCGCNNSDLRIKDNGTDYRRGSRSVDVNTMLRTKHTDIDSENRNARGELNTRGGSIGARGTWRNKNNAPNRSSNDIEGIKDNDKTVQKTTTDEKQQNSNSNGNMNGQRGSGQRGRRGRGRGRGGRGRQS